MSEGESTWQDVLKTQQEELRRLEMESDALDAETGQLDVDINKALRRNSSKIGSLRPSSGTGRVAVSVIPGSPARGRDLVAALHEEAPDLPDIQVERERPPPEPAPPSTPDIDSKAPDTAAK